MEIKTPTWNKDELKAYSFIYLMHADLETLYDEVAYIKTKVGDATYQKMLLEFRKDNDYQSIQKIKLAHNVLGYSKKEDAVFLKEMKELFTQHSNEHPIEIALYDGLKKILS